VADVECGIQEHKSIEDPECVEQQHESAELKVRRLIPPTRKSKRQAEKVLMTANAIETRRKKGVKTR